MIDAYDINRISAAVICFLATWCVLSPCVKDGIVGKLLFSILAIAAFVTLGADTKTPHPAPELAMNAAIAMLCIRHVVISIRSRTR